MSMFPTVLEPLFVGFLLSYSRIIFFMFAPSKYFSTTSANSEWEEEIQNTAGSWASSQCHSRDYSIRSIIGITNCNKGFNKKIFFFFCNSLFLLSQNKFELKKKFFFCFVVALSRVLSPRSIQLNLISIKWLWTHFY
jgi:hypothetical protein